MRWRSLLLLGFVTVIPTAALASGIGPPLAKPPSPDVPLGPPDFDAPPTTRPPVDAPPIDLVLPDHPRDKDGDFDVPVGPRDPIPKYRHHDPNGDDDGKDDDLDTPDKGDDGSDHPNYPGSDVKGDPSDPTCKYSCSSSGAAGNDGAVVPEPSTALLLFLGLSGFALRRR